MFLYQACINQRDPAEQAHSPPCKQHMERSSHIFPPQRSNAKLKDSKGDSVSQYTLLFQAAGVQESALGHFFLLRKGKGRKK